jgi:flagellar protein FliO/FliZ
MRMFVVIGSFLLSRYTLAEEALVADAPEVGKHVMANMDAGSMILSLLMVLGLIIVSALVLKRFNIAQQGDSKLKVITSLSLGAKERVIVVQAGKNQLLLGVTAHNITVLDTLSEPIVESSLAAKDMPSSIFSLFSAKIKK